MKDLPALSKAHNPREWSATQSSKMERDPVLQMLERNRSVTQKLSGTAGGETSLNSHAFEPAAPLVRSFMPSPSTSYSTQSLS